MVGAQDHVIRRIRKLIGNAEDVLFPEGHVPANFYDPRAPVPASQNSHFGRHRSDRSHIAEHAV